MKKVLLALFIFNVLSLNAQEHFEVEASTGWNFYNLFDDEIDINDLYVGYGLQYGIDAWYSRKINNTFDTRIGIGYANFYHLDFAVSDISNYMSLRLGTNIQTFWKPMKVTTSLSSYILLHQNLQDRFNFQRRFFTNLDLGLKFRLGDKLSLKLDSPISLIKMYQDDNMSIIRRFNNTPLVVDADVELTGLNLGLIYRFKDSKTIIPTMRFSGVEDALSIELSSSILVSDLINRPEDKDNFFRNPIIQNSVDVWLSKQVHEKFDARIGLGYSNFYHIDSEVFFADTAQSTHYLNFRLGTDIKTRWEKIDLSFAMSNYISLEKYPQDLFGFQQRFFTNLDLGVKFKVSDKLNLRVTTPVTLSPMLRGINWGYRDDNQDLVRVPSTSVGTAGLNVGLIYNFK